jgi:hypothetical protein
MFPRTVRLDSDLLLHLCQSPTVGRSLEAVHWLAKGLLVRAVDIPWTTCPPPFGSYMQTGMPSFTSTSTSSPRLKRLIINGGKTEQAELKNVSGLEYFMCHWLWSSAIILCQWILSLIWWLLTNKARGTPQQHSPTILSSTEAITNIPKFCQQLTGVRFHTKVMIFILVNAAFSHNFLSFTSGWPLPLRSSSCLISSNLPSALPFKEKQYPQ